jgi:hypothetical protein
MAVDQRIVRVNAAATLRYNAIQDAIDACDGSTPTVIRVMAGDYYGLINLNKSNVSLIGEDRARCRLIQDDSTDVRAEGTLQIDQCSNVLVSNLTIISDHDDDVGEFAAVFINNPAGSAVVYDNIEISDCDIQAPCWGVWSAIIGFTRIRILRNRIWAQNAIWNQASNVSLCEVCFNHQYYDGNFRAQCCSLLDWDCNGAGLAGIACYDNLLAYNTGFINSQMIGPEAGSDPSKTYGLHCAGNGNAIIGNRVHIRKGGPGDPLGDHIYRLLGQDNADPTGEANYWGGNSVHMEFASDFGMQPIIEAFTQFSPAANGTAGAILVNNHLTWTAPLVGIHADSRGVKATASGAGQVISVLADGLRGVEHMTVEVTDYTLAWADRIMLQTVDNVTAPAAASGVGRIYIDSADGDLKVVFGDGTVKTITTDTP